MKFRFPLPRLIALMTTAGIGIVFSASSYAADAPDEPEAISIVGVPVPAQDRWESHVSLAGIGSLYWAARHPAGAWKILLPIDVDDESNFAADSRARCFESLPTTARRAPVCP